MSFRTRVAAAIARIFARLGEPSSVQLGGEMLTEIVSVRRSVDQQALEDLFAGAVRQDAEEIALQRSQVADRPQKGDQITREDGVFTLVEPAQSRDSFGLVWICAVKSS